MKELDYLNPLRIFSGKARRTWLVALLLAVTLTGAHAQQKSFTYDFRNKPLKEVLSVLESQGYAILYGQGVNQEIAKPVSLKVSGATLDQFLGEAFRNTQLTYKIVDRQILVSPRQGQQAASASQPMLISGKVIDEEGLPIAGASVSIKNASGGTVTNSGGAFQIGVPATGATLLVACMGKDDKEVAVTPGTTQYTVQLSASVSEVGQVVAIGYFNRRKDNFTGTAVVVSGEDLKKVNPNNLLQGIQAFDPSFRLTADNFAGSDPNQMPKINVRGAASVPTGAGGDVLRRDNLSTSVNLPTFILDGYEVGVEKIYDLDINRVASISLLKDAAATAVYGSRAANGVLVITTIAPKEGQLRLTANYELAASFPDLGSYDILNAGEKLEYERLAGLYELEGFNRQELQELYYKKHYRVVSGVDTYWLSQPVQNALGNKLSLFIEGGSPSVRYGINGIYQTSPGVMKDSGRDRLGVGVDFSYNANSKLLFKNALNVANVTGQDSPYGSFSEYVKTNPYYPKTDERGLIIQNVDTWLGRKSTGEDDNTYVLNPMWNSTLSSFYKTDYWEFNDIFSLEWNFTGDLRLRALASFLQKNTGVDFFTSPYANQFYDYTGDKLTERGEYTYGALGESTLDASATLTYGKALGRHYFNAALGTNIRSSNYTTKYFTAVGFTNDRFSDIGFAKGYKDNASPSSSESQDRLFGAFLSVNYSFDNRFLADLSVRADGSSKFGTDNKVAPFWAAGIGWNVHHEAFLRDQHVVSQLRLKANTGLTGSVSFTPYQANTLYTYNKKDWYSTGVGVEVTQYGNENLKWQRTRNYDVGLDLGFLEDRLFATGRWYYKLTKDMLTDVTLPPSTGFGYYKDNLGDIKNVGYEFGLKLNVYKTKDWNINLTGNFVHNQNTLLKISDALKKMNDKADQTQTDNEHPENMGAPLLRFVEGQSLNTIYAVRSLGIDPETVKRYTSRKTAR